MTYTKDEALALALEALENSIDLVREDAYNAEKLYGNYPPRQGKIRGLKVLADDHEKAIAAIKQALAAQQEPRCAVIVEVFGKDWRLDYMSLPVGKHRLYTQEYVYTTPPAARRPHVTDGSPCWCEPETSYTDPETGASVVVHKGPQ